MPMPYKGFEWVAETEFAAIDWLQQSEEQAVGYIVECDLEYPAEIHDSHNEYPLAPQRLSIEVRMLSDKQVEIKRHYERTRTKDNIKLIPNLMSKPKYVTHYFNLKYYLEHGLRLTKVHRVVRFQQSRWMAPYIQKNSDMRKEARNAFEKDLFKLMNNAIYGKTCENIKKRTSIRLLSDIQKANQLVEKPHCLNFEIFSEGLVGVEMRKIRAKIDKPFYVGFAVLELSKLKMAQFHYDVIKARYGDKAHLLFTDTDSLMYHIETPDIYKDMLEMKQHFDLSDMPANFSDFTNEKVVGKMKDETQGDPILEFVGLRPKMYSFKTVQMTNNVAVFKEKHTAKGISRAAARTLRHEQYKSQLETPLENYVTTRRIGAKLHRIYAIEVYLVMIL